MPVCKKPSLKQQRPSKKSKGHAAPKSVLKKPGAKKPGAKKPGAKKPLAKKRRRTKRDAIPGEVFALGLTCRPFPEMPSNVPCNRQTTGYHFLLVCFV